METLLADAAMMRLLAHPLRMRILGSLRVDGPATSAILARRLATDTGQTSHHLRLLARHGLVADAPEQHRRGRERWWKAVHDSTVWSDLGVGGADTMRAVQHAARQVYDQAIDTYHAEVARQEWSAGWQRVAASSDYVIRTTPERLDRLCADIERLVRGAGEEAADTEKVLVVLHTYPLRAPG
ncbi:winged helix-turn-helix domain-containing protein [Paractinoplanes rishiriensis]|uniref:Transcriptional regulator n=1 Tax=Paractinoplanes rishiriensis TaxID=1050105 RepID=A0A919JZ14_9ACTN|nr:helix-turn-helix domain-containing protein [Actinoplanes rishiriensis]GIE97530.1 transcriptional regulator [Actinoplanes rishiriensis]